MDARAAEKDSDAASPSPAAAAPTRILNSRPTTDTANMTQVLVAATTTPVLAKDVPDNILTEKTETAKITDTLEALALTGDEKTQRTEPVQDDTSNTTAGEKGSTDGNSKTAAPTQQENVTSKSVPEPFAQQLQQMAIAPVDQPDPRLIDALDHPRDRVFVIKTEKEFLDFVKNEKLEEHALPPANAYHRLLVHKMAEYYRLTHIADSSGQSVKICRGESARIPPKLLCDWPTNLQQQQQQAAKVPANGTFPMVKIMRRTTPSESGSKAPSRANSRKDGSGDSDDDNNKSSNGSNRPTTREEREAAYQEARARIFKDFVESPPETPPPRTEKKNRKEQPDDFSGRSQFYPVLAPAMPHPAQFYPQQVPVYPDPNMHMPPPAQPGPPRFNPMTANFTPGAPTFTPAAVPVNPGFSPRAGYPYPQPAPQMGMYPPQLPPQNRNFYPQPPGPPRSQGMQLSYSSTGYPQPTSPPRSTPYGMPPQQQGRGMQQGMHQPVGWNPQGGIPLSSRSTSAPGYDMGFVPSPQQAGVQPQMGPWGAQQQAWGGGGMRGGRM